VVLLIPAYVLEVLLGNVLIHFGEWILKVSGLPQ